MADHLLSHALNQLDFLARSPFVSRLRLIIGKEFSQHILTISIILVRCTGITVCIFEEWHATFAVRSLEMRRVELIASGYLKIYIISFELFIDFHENSQQGRVES